MRLPAIAMLAVSVLFWKLYDPYEPAGPVLLSAPRLADATSRAGDVSEREGRFVLQVPAGGKIAELRYVLPGAPSFKMIRLRAGMAADGVVQGRNLWNRARILLAQYDAQHKWIATRHEVASATGNLGWKRHEKVFELQPEARQIEVVMQQGGAVGTAEFGDIEAQPVRLRVSYNWWRMVFAAMWLAVAVLYYPRCRMGSRKLRIPILVNVVAIVFGVLMPATYIEDTVEYAKTAKGKYDQRIALERRHEQIPTADGKIGVPAPKADHGAELVDRFFGMVADAHRTGHFTLYASLCFLVYLSAALERQHPVYFVKVGADVMLFAMATESLQFLTIDRTASLFDLVVDLCGMALAIVVFVCVLPLVSWRLSRTS